MDSEVAGLRLSVVVVPILASACSLVEGTGIKDHGLGLVCFVSLVGRERSGSDAFNGSVIEHHAVFLSRVLLMSKVTLCDAV